MTPRKYGSQKTTTEEGKTEYQREYMRKYRRVKKKLLEEKMVVLYKVSEVDITQETEDEEIIKDLTKQFVATMNVYYVVSRKSFQTMAWGYLKFIDQLIEMQTWTYDEKVQFLLKSIIATEKMILNFIDKENAVIQAKWSKIKETAQKRLVNWTETFEEIKELQNASSR